MVDQATEAAFATTAATLAGEYVKLLLGQVDRGVRNQILPHLKDFEDYLVVTYRKCNSVKIIIDPDQVHRLTDIYVKGRYRSSSKVMNDDEIAQEVRDNQRVIVQGFGGIGKTMLLKYVWLSIFKERGGRIPVFVELRRLNDLQVLDLQVFLRASLSPSGRPLGEAQFQTLLKAGRFIFLFDALDEVADDLRGNLERQILELAFKFPNCGVLVSSRQDERFRSWETFRVFHSVPFDKKQIEEVVDKVPLDHKMKAKFLNEVISKKFEIYKSFLSTPLLAIMMLITYEQFADIPEKIHIFYRCAFQTLYTLHDAGKETFRRRRKSNLSEDDFCKVFSIFCLSTYMRSDFSFTRQEVINELALSAKRANVTIDVSDYLSEVCESVNLLYEEGDVISFTHRSFQEYFTADVLTGHFAALFSKLIRRVPNSASDSVYRMAYEMNSDLVEEQYLVPTWREHEAKIKAGLGKDTDQRELIKTFGVFMVISPHRTSADGRSFVAECYALSELADFMRRALALLPEGKVEDWSDGFGQIVTNASSKRFIRAVCAEVGWKGKELPQFAAFNFDDGGVILENMGQDEFRADLGERLLQMAERNAGIATVLGEAIIRQKGILVGLERAMRKVSGRSKGRAETLDELLAGATF